MKPKELTIRGLILGALITTIFTAANVYLGLKVGLTFASSIPAAVISMALSVGMAMLTGLIIAWAIAVPILTSMQPAAAGVELADHTARIWSTQVRFIGAGAIAIAAIYTLARLAKPVVGGLVSTLASSRAAEREDDRDRDIPASWIMILTLACLVIAAYLAFAFARSTVLAPSAITLTLIAIPFVLIGGFLIAGICGYMAGLIGASNSPISGVGILSIVLCASVLILAVAPTGTTQPALVAFALFITAIVFACATISNDNLQDLKTGQLVGAVLSEWYSRRARRTPNPDRAERLGTLVASGLIVGESLWGVLNAGLIVGRSNEAPIGLVPADFAYGPWLGVIGFVGIIIWLYTWMLRQSRTAPGR
jgi:uncharacterized oligopeptide transporter (OPT) family protein